jgi:hypothetical protein
MSRQQSSVYYPEDLALLGNVLDKVVASLPEDQRTRSNRIEVAKNLLASAAAGESDPTKLELTARISVKPVAIPERRHEPRANRNPFAICFRYQAQTA